MPGQRASSYTGSGRAASVSVACSPGVSGVFPPCPPPMAAGLAGREGPAFGARPCVPAVPAQVGAVAAAIGHHLVSRQADAATSRQDFGVGPVLPSTGPSAAGPVTGPASPGRALGTARWSRRRGSGGRSPARAGGFERRVLSPGSPVGQWFIWPVADLGCARVIWPARSSMCHAPPPPFRRAPGLPRCVCPPVALCPPPYRGRAHPSVSSQVSPS